MVTRFKLPLFILSILFLAGFFLYSRVPVGEQILGVQSDEELEELFKTLIPEKSYLREFTPLPELGSKTFLIMYIDDPLLSPEITENDIAELITCPRASEGRYIEGNYHLAIVEDGKIINDKLIPGYPYPIDPEAFKAATDIGLEVKDKIRLATQNLKSNMYWEYGDPQPAENERFDIVDIKLLRFKDYNGDGLENDIKLLGPTWACGHTDKLIAGYTPDKQVHVYPIEMPDGETYNWVTGFNPAGDGTAKQGYECGDHGADTQEHNTFEFDKTKQKYALKSHEKDDCNDLYP